MTDVLEEALEHLVRGIVEFPDDVRVDSRGLRRGRVLEVRVHPDDLGKVIGRGGRTARALRTVIGSLAGNAYVRVDLLDTDEIRQPAMQLVVGRIGRPHGIRGELTVQVHTDDPDSRFAAGSVLVTEPAARGPLTVSSSRWHSGRLLIMFAGCDDRNSAEDLRGTFLVMDSAEVGPAADPDEFNDYELIGLDVATVAGEPVGVVADVLHQGQDLLVIRPAQSGAEEVLVPFVATLVPEVDIKAGRLVIDPPPGLLDLRAPDQAGGVTFKVDIITVFPDYFAPLRVSLIGKAVERGEIELGVHDLRTWAHDVHHSVDDAPFGGGPGMVMKPEPWGEAIDAVVPEGAAPRLVLPSPAGVPFTQELAARYALESHLVFACGRYEGIDARVAEDARARMPVDEVTIGDYVLAGGEPAVLVMIEAVCRLLPGVIGNAASAPDDSFGGGSGPMAGLLEGPAYTRPRVWRGREVPPVLLSGDHAAIARWRRDAALRQTAANRPDLAERLARDHGEAAGGLDSRDREVLSEAGFPFSGQDMAD